MIFIGSNDHEAAGGQDPSDLPLRNGRFSLLAWISAWEASSQHSWENLSWHIPGDTRPAYPQTIRTDTYILPGQFVLATTMSILNCRTT